MPLNQASKPDLFLQHRKKVAFIVICIILQAFCSTLAIAQEEEHYDLLKGYVKTINEPTYSLAYNSNESSESSKLNHRISELEANAAVLKNRIEVAEYDNDNHNRYESSNYSYNNDNNTGYYHSNNDNISEISQQFQIIRSQIEELQHIVDKVDENFAKFDMRMSSLEAQSYRAPTPESTIKKNSSEKNQVMQK